MAEQENGEKNTITHFQSNTTKNTEKRRKQTIYKENRY